MAPSPLLLSSDALSGQDAAHELDKQVERAEQLKSILQTSELVWQGRAECSHWNAGLNKWGAYSKAPSATRGGWL
ncbi:MAG: hypothetical protein ACI87O_000133 [Planctomycetota bacterium]|jgi:hypothetical protein